MDPNWRRATLEETEALLANLGLTGPFWNCALGIVIPNPLGRKVAIPLTEETRLAQHNKVRFPST